MIYIEFIRHCHGIKITNDKTFTDVMIHTRSYEQEEEIALKLIKKLVEDDD